MENINIKIFDIQVTFRSDVRALTEKLKSYQVYIYFYLCIEF